MTVENVIVVVVLLALAAGLERWVVPEPLKGWFWGFVVLCLIVAALRFFNLLHTVVL